jgi:hypothetical protein
MKRSTSSRKPTTTSRKPIAEAVTFRNIRQIRDYEWTGKGADDKAAQAAVNEFVHSTAKVGDKAEALFLMGMFGDDDEYLLDDPQAFVDAYIEEIDGAKRRTKIAKQAAEAADKARKTKKAEPAPAKRGGHARRADGTILPRSRQTEAVVTKKHGLPGFKVSEAPATGRRARQAEAAVNPPKSTARRGGKPASRRGLGVRK